MSLSLSFHINFVQIAKDGQLHWAPRHAWQTVAGAIFADSAGQVAVSASDLELELNQHLGPELTLVFPDGFKDWLGLQTSAGAHRPSWLAALLNTTERVEFSDWNPDTDLDSPTLWFFDEPSEAHFKLLKSLPEGSGKLHVLKVSSDEDEVLSWGAAIADLYLKEKLVEETEAFFRSQSHLKPLTLTSEGPQPGLHSPLLGLPQALSDHLSRANQKSDNHLFLGWENFYFSYRDSLGVWRSQPLQLQPFHSFKVDPHLDLVPDLDGSLHLPVAFSLNARPTVMDILLQHAKFPLAATQQDSTRLQDGLRTFFNMKEPQVATLPLLQSLLEDIYWLVEGLRTSDDCLVEGPLSEIFFKYAPSPAPRGFEAGDSSLTEVHFAEQNL